MRGTLTRDISMRGTLMDTSNVGDFNEGQV